jgi:glycosyltransferase involved in cell wall biosynthesis
MHPLTVAWDDSLARRDKGGTGVYAARLRERFLQSEEVNLLVMEGWQRSQNRGIGTLSDLLWTHAYLPAKLLQLKPDLLHSPAFIAPYAAPCPLVVTVHDVTFLLYASHFSRWWQSYLKVLMPKVISSAAAIICGSEHSRRDIAGAYGISPEKIRVIPYGVDHSRFRPGVPLDAAWASSLGIREGYVLHVGTLSHRKDIPTLLRAVARLRDAGTWGMRQVVLAGGAGNQIKGADAVYAAIRDLDLKDNVVLTGHVPDEHVAGLYASASLLAMPSLYEGFGFPVLEAMAAGTPVVCSDTSSLPEVGGDAVVYFRCQDDERLVSALSEVLGSSTLAAEMRRKGLERASQFTWDRNAKETIALYREVAGA